MNSTNNTDIEIHNHLSVTFNVTLLCTFQIPNLVIRHVKISYTQALK